MGEIFAGNRGASILEGYLCTRPCPSAQGVVVVVGGGGGGGTWWSRQPGMFTKIITGSNSHRIQTQQESCLCIVATYEIQQLLSVNVSALLRLEQLGGWIALNLGPPFSFLLVCECKNTSCDVQLGCVHGDA